jgi:hypothetical protein
MKYRGVKELTSARFDGPAIENRLLTRAPNLHSRKSEFFSKSFPILEWSWRDAGRGRQGYWQEPSSTNWLAVAIEARERPQVRIF